MDSRNVDSHPWRNSVTDGWRVWLYAKWDDACYSSSRQDAEATYPTTYPTPDSEIERYELMVDIDIDNFQKTSYLLERMRRYVLRHRCSGKRKFVKISSMLEKAIDAELDSTQPNWGVIVRLLSVARDIVAISSNATLAMQIDYCEERFGITSSTALFV